MRDGFKDAFGLLLALWIMPILIVLAASIAITALTQWTWHHWIAAAWITAWTAYLDAKVWGR